jgi:hypothetical protein
VLDKSVSRRSGLSKAGKPFLAVVVPLSPLRPHFLGPAYRRGPGPATIPASQQEIDECIAYRNSKVRYILERKGEIVLVQQRRNSRLHAVGTLNGEHEILDCNEHFATLKKVSSTASVTHPLSVFELKMNDGKPGQLMLLLKPY